MDLLTLKEMSKQEILTLIERAILIKKKPLAYAQSLSGKTLAMLFEKKSTRTRISFEAGMTQLGGHAIFIDWKTTQLEKADLKDELKCIDSYADIIMARVYEHKQIEKIAKYATKPVINGLSDTYHPCQILGDLMTIKEKFKKFNALKLAYVGDGNNVCNSLIIGCKKIGIKIAVATPKGFEPLEKPDLLSTEPKKAVKDSDIVYTDTWISMGDEKEREKRLKIFPPYQVNKTLLSQSGRKPLFMHCLPAYRGYEVADDVMDSKQSIVFEQAENRLHIQKAIILKLLKKV